MENSIPCPWKSTEARRKGNDGRNYVVVGITQKLVIEFDEARYLIWLESKATGGKLEMIKRSSPLVEESKKAAQYPEGKEPALIPSRIYKYHDVATLDLEFKGLMSSSPGKKIEQIPYEIGVSDNSMPKKIDMAL